MVKRTVLKFIGILEVLVVALHKKGYVFAAANPITAYVNFRPIHIP